MKALLVVIFGTLLATIGSAQTPIRDLPKGAVVIETARIASLKHSNRLLVLWMQDPKKNPTGYSATDIYTCPDTTRGSYYSGPTRVSLVNPATRAIINTIKISSLYDEDSLDLPYAIRKGNYYRVLARVARTVEAKPNIIWLKDYNGDGRALEFALFEAEACMGLQTTLIGYSEKQDRVINYPITLDVTEDGKHKKEVSTWVDYLFQEKPKSAGHWKYEIDYRGRAGSLDKWEVRYNAAKEQFEGSRVSIPGNLEG